MYLAARVSGSVRRASGVTWTVGKGFVGRLTLGSNDFDILQHSEFWPHDIDTMTEQEWRATDKSMSEGRSLTDARALKLLYGTAVGVSLRHPRSEKPMGCITLHTPASHPLTTVQAETCIELLAVQAVHIAEYVADEARLE
jgi:hypothetical protein